MASDRRSSRPRAPCSTPWPRATASAIEWLDVVAGGAAIDAYGTAFRAEDLDAVAACDAILLGAVGGPRWDDPAARVRPEQALFALRGGLELFANLRPVSVLPALVPVVAGAPGGARGRRTC